MKANPRTLEEVDYEKVTTAGLANISSGIESVNESQMSQKGTAAEEEEFDDEEHQRFWPFHAKFIPPEMKQVCIIRTTNVVLHIL